jgi:hypothetical protein
VAALGSLAALAARQLYAGAMRLRAAAYGAAG